MIERDVSVPYFRVYDPAVVDQDGVRGQMMDVSQLVWHPERGLEIEGKYRSGVWRVGKYYPGDSKVVLMEYAGFTDDKGGRIYERDILRIGERLARVFKGEDGVWEAWMRGGDKVKLISVHAEAHVVGNDIENMDLWNQS